MTTATWAPFSSRHGTWVDPFVRKLYARNRLAFYRHGSNCQWHCNSCLESALVEHGADIPVGTTARVYLSQQDAAGPPPPGPYVTGPLQGSPAVSGATASAGIADLLLTPVGLQDPQTAAHTIPAFRLWDDRLGFQARATQVYTVRCDRCPSSEGTHSWRLGTTPPGMFVFRVSANYSSSLPKVCGLPDPQDRLRAFQAMEWNAAWFCHLHLAEA